MFMFADELHKHSKETAEIDKNILMLEKVNWIIIANRF